MEPTFGYGAILLLLQAIYRGAVSIQIDNGVVGTPTISCGTEVVTFWVKTRNPFQGKVYVKGEYGKDECSKNFGDGNGGTTGTIQEPSPSTQDPSCPPCPPCDNENTNRFSFTRFKRQVPTDVQQIPEMAHLSVKLGTCNVKRDRSLTPPGVKVTFTVVVSFHQNFVTKVDRAYQIQCAYMETDKTVTTEIDVSMPTTAELTAQANMPVCEYTIRRDSPDGPQIQFAKVGDKVYHRWECVSDMQDMFSMLVHDCFVDDGQGQKVQVVDDRGCSVDQFVLPSLTYQTTLLAHVETHVFKFADRPVLDFQCAMTICVTDEPECTATTPPNCGVVPRRRRNIIAETVNRSIGPLSAPNEDNMWRLHAQRITVVDLDEDIKSDELEGLESQLRADQAHVDDEELKYQGKMEYYRHLLQRIGPRVCLSIAGFGVLVALCTFIFTLASIVLGGLYIVRKKSV